MSKHRPKDGEVKVLFWGGPEDGAERWLPQPVSEVLEIEGQTFDETDDAGVKVATSTKVYLYSLNSDRAVRYYRYQGDRIDRREVT